MALALLRGTFIVCGVVGLAIGVASHASVAVQKPAPLLRPGSSCGLLNQSHTDQYVAGVLSIPKFTTERAAKPCELRNRETMAQLHLPPARAPCSLLGGRPCHPSFCGVFHRGPCFPQYLPPIGEDLRLTIVSTDKNDSAGKSTDEAPKGAGGADRSGANANADHQTLDSLSAMYAALRACWVPPPKGSARHGMEYTVRFAFKRDGQMIAPPRVTYSSHDAPGHVRDIYRDAVNAALERCTPLHFSKGLGGAVAGRPIAIRFVDDRTIGNVKSR